MIRFSFIVHVIICLFLLSPTLCWLRCHHGVRTQPEDWPGMLSLLLSTLILRQTLYNNLVLLVYYVLGTYCVRHQECTET